MRQHSCHGAAARSAAGAPADGAGWRVERARACRVAAAGCRGARRRERTPAGTHTPAQCLPGCRSPPAPIAAQVAGVRARLATAERSRARSRGASGRQCKAVSTTWSTSLWSLEWQSQTQSLTQCWRMFVLKWHGSTSTIPLGITLHWSIIILMPDAKLYLECDCMWLWG